MNSYLVSTPVEFAELSGIRLLVKREDLCCPTGPNFSKMRGVFSALQKRPEVLFGVVDTLHSKGGWAVAWCARKLGKQCRVYYPHYKAEVVPTPKLSQIRAQELGAELFPMKATSAFLMRTRMVKGLDKLGGFSVPNGLKFPETVSETCTEVIATAEMLTVDNVVVSISSGTIAAGVLTGLALVRERPVNVFLHLGYSRSLEQVRRYLNKMAGPSVMGKFRESEIADFTDLFQGENVLRFIDEGYNYTDVARDGAAVTFPSNPFYDLKAWRWLERSIKQMKGSVLFWNIGG